MQVRESAKDGTAAKVVDIRVTTDEAKLLMKLLIQGIDHPPKVADGYNTDYDAVNLGGTLMAELEKIVR
jgi:hypothetical protein